MTTSFEARTFTTLFDRGPDSIFQDLRFEKCSFDRCGLGTNAGRRTRVLDVEVTDSRLGSVVCGPVIFERVVVDGLRTKEPLFMWGAVFRHVTLRGRIGRINFREDIHPASMSAALGPEVRAANRAFYGATDWALDIAEASFLEADLQGVPAQLVRRDPATQVVVTREAARAGMWRADPQIDRRTRLFLDELANSQRPDEVLVVPSRHPRRAAMLDDLRRLRDMGVAETD